MMSRYIGFKEGKEIEWLELNLLLTNESLSKSKISDLAGDFEEQVIDSWIGLLELRSSLYHIPIYTIQDNIISANCSWEDIPEYFLCLYYSFNGANDHSGGTGLFEMISAHALKNFLNGEVYTLGFPAGKGFNDNLDEIAKKCFEERNLPADGSYKDDGVDVLGYKPFLDNRGSNLYVLLQCAAGKNWTLKRPINMNRWTNYIIWFTDNIVQSISTVDFVEKEVWYKRTSAFGMLFDRLRIYNYLYESEVDDVLRREVIGWCARKIEEGI